jgi:hypothetical protein
VDRPAKQGLELERAREGVTTTEEGVRGSGIYRDTEQWNLVLCTSGFVSVNTVQLSFVL